MAFGELPERFRPIHLPIGGKTYVVHGPNADDWQRMQALWAVAVAVDNGETVPDHVREQLLVGDTDEPDFMRDVLGHATYDEMVTDGVPGHVIHHAASTAFIYCTSGIELAEAYWNDDEGKAPAPTTRTRSGRAGAGANTTKPPASGSGTTTPRKSSPRNSKAKPKG